MSKRKLIYSLIICLIILNLILLGIIFYSRDQKIKIIFFDVGQGDAILIAQGTNQILIDGGPDAQKELEKLGQYIPFWDRHIEIVMATHPDQDHIDGLVGVFKNYEIGQVIDSSVESDSGVYKNYREIIEQKNISRLAGEKGMKIKLAGAEIEILYPTESLEKNLKDTNAGSLVFKLTFGQNSFLFTGDFPIEKENILLTSGADLSADILKVAHHGSKYGTGDEFLAAVKPQTAIISVGKNNRYGHPALELLDRLKNGKINILRTDELGDIEYICAKEKTCQVSY